MAYGRSQTRRDKRCQGETRGVKSVKRDKRCDSAGASLGETVAVLSCHNSVTTVSRPLMPQECVVTTVSRPLMPQHCHALSCVHNSVTPSPNLISHQPSLSRDMGHVDMDIDAHTRERVG
jgi:hypothetical protein